MKVQLEPEEARELLVLVVDRLLDEAGLSDDDRAAVRRWRSQSMKAGADGMRELSAKLNAEIERTLQTKAKSAVMKPDWR
ncbi:MAG: hypothetical protein Q7T33_07695 [Dehalococcoidia bacterium]|nr:hypothetical protein [Dehalococcoidia bacterium]